MIENPILPGFHPDPCICRRGDDFYLAVSSFEWFPGVPVYHSRDLKHWELYTNILQDETVADLRRLPSAKGVWAPCLTWCESEQLFYLLFSCMNSMNARFFDVDNFVITAPELTGPWSEPVYLHSAGFDPSILHDGDRKYIVSLEWETRDGHHKPGEICVVEYDPKAKHIKGLPQRIWRGGTRRGCIEAPHLYRKDGYYYLLCAEGGTGYGHCVTIARAKNVFGPYENCPYNPILTATPDFDEMDNDDSAKPERFNPDSVLQKAGHGSLIDTPDGEWYMTYHCGRPLLPRLRCTLGRETCIEKMAWTKDGWPVRADNLCDGVLKAERPDNRARVSVEESLRVPAPVKPPASKTDFNIETIPACFYSPRVDYRYFTSLQERRGWLRMRGQESLSSLNRASFLGRKLTSLQAQVETEMEFSPERYQHYAGLAIYYDQMDYIMLRKSCPEGDGRCVLDVLRVTNGDRIYSRDRISVGEGPVRLFLKIGDRKVRFSAELDGKRVDIGEAYDLSELSDEYCKAGEFTGTFVGMACVDALLHEKYADFHWFIYEEQREDEHEA